MRLVHGPVPEYRVPLNVPGIPAAADCVLPVAYSLQVQTAFFVVLRILFNLPVSRSKKRINCCKLRGIPSKGLHRACTGHRGGRFRVLIRQAVDYTLTERTPPGYRLTNQPITRSFSTQDLETQIELGSIQNSATTRPVLPFTGGTSADAFPPAGGSILTTTLLAGEYRHRKLEAQAQPLNRCTPYQGKPPIFGGDTLWGTAQMSHPPQH